MNATWWRPVLTVALFSALPFAVFLNSNRANLDPEAALGLYALFLLVPGIAAVLVADRRGGPAARERAAVIFAALSFVLFQFQIARSLAEVVGLESDAVAGLIWLALFAAALVLAIRISRHPLSWNYAAVAGALLLALPVVQYATFGRRRRLPISAPPPRGSATCPRPSVPPTSTSFSSTATGARTSSSARSASTTAPFSTP